MTRIGKKSVLPTKGWAIAILAFGARARNNQGTNGQTKNSYQ
jgi:hypothetical protein